MKEYKRALKRLTVGYALAIVLACAAFTLPVFITASHQIDENARLPHEATHQSQSTSAHQSEADHAAQSQSDLLRTTLVFDIILISLGIVASYIFARKTLAPLEEAHKAQERFTANASHELRTPLAVLQTELEVALKAKKTVAGLEGTVQGAVDEIRRLSLLTEKLLQLTKTDSAKAKKEVINLSAVAEGVARQLERKHHITIDRHIDPSLKEVEANEMLLRQLIEILVDNAVKYAGKDGPKITMQLTRTGEGSQLDIMDKGIGISKADLPHIFDRLYRGTNATDQEGHGLGLALAKSIADLHGWKLSITSELGKGTKVRLYLPTLKSRS